MSIYQWRLDGFSQKYIFLYLYLGLFFENRKNSGLTLVTRWPGRERWPKWLIDRVTQWPSSMFVIYPQNGDRIATANRVTSLQPTFSVRNNFAPRRPCRCDPFQHMPHVAWSARLCVSSCWAHVSKRLNRSKCRLGCRLMCDKGTSY